MAVRARRGEEADITRIVAREGLPILSTITGTGTLEGGSFVKLQPGLAAFGTSIRCNAEAAEQLREVLARIGWELLVVPLPGYTIHIDLHLAMVDVDRALVDVPGPAVLVSRGARDAAASRRSTPTRARPGRSTPCACGRAAC